MSKSPSLGRSLLVAAVVALGAAAAWLMAEQWLYNVITGAVTSREPFENIYFTVTGEPVLATSTSGSTQNTEKIVSLSGEPLSIASQDLLYSDVLTALEKPRFAPRSPNWETRITATNDSGVPPIYWYLVHDGQVPGRAYGLGFHATTRTVSGYFARGGFTASLPPRDDWFEIPGAAGLAGVTTLRGMAQEPRWSGGTRFLLLADGKIWKIDLARKQLTTLLDCPQAFRLGQVWRILDTLPPKSVDADPWTATSITPLDGIVREPDGLIVVNPQSGDHKRYPLPLELRNKMLSPALLPDGQLLLIAQRDWYDPDEQIVWLDPSGQIAKQQPVRRKTRRHEPSLAKIGWQTAIAAPLPIVTAGVTAVFAPFGLLEEKKSPSYGHALATVLQKTWPSILTVLAVSIAAAALAYRRHRRYGLPQPAAWAAFTFLFGIPGWIAYRFHRPWPVLEDCPTCRQPSPRDRSTCLDCGALFPQPPQTGIEVFA